MSPTNLQPPTTEQIAQLAYLIWEQEGQPKGRNVVHWLQAEEQLWADYRLDSGKLDAATMAAPVIEKARRAPKRSKKAKAEPRIQ